MINYAIKNLKRNKTINILIILQLSIIMILTTVMVSNITSRYKYYNPIKEQLSKTGVLLHSQHYADTDQRLFTDINQITDNMKSVKAVYPSYSHFVLVPELNEYCQYYAYPDAFFEKMADEFKDGEWYTDNSNTIYAAVSNNTHGIKTGDIIHFSTETDEYEIVITGVLKEGAKVLGFDKNLYNAECNFNDLYETIYEDNYLKLYNETIDKTEKQHYKELMDLGDPYDARYNFPSLFMSETEMRKMNIDKYFYGNMFIEFDENISEKEFNENMEWIKSFKNMTSVIKLKDINSQSLSYIKSQIASILPLIICMLTLVLITALSICIISIERMLKTYSIFFICGSSWKNLIKINIFESLFICLVSTIIVCAFFVASGFTGWLSFTVIEFGIFQILAHLMVMALYVLMSILIPVIVMRKRTPKQILTQRL